MLIQLNLVYNIQNTFILDNYFYFSSECFISLLVPIITIIISIIIIILTSANTCNVYNAGTVLEAYTY